jgi:hypothetical protein
VAGSFFWLCAEASIAACAGDSFLTIRGKIFKQAQGAWYAGGVEEESWELIENVFPHPSIHFAAQNTQGERGEDLFSHNLFCFRETYFIIL